MTHRTIKKTLAEIFQYYLEVLSKEPIWAYNDAVLLERRFFFRVDRAYYSEPYLILIANKKLWLDQILVMKMDTDLSQTKERLRVMPSVLQWFGEGSPEGEVYRAKALRQLSKQGRVVLKDSSDWREMKALLQDKRERLRDLSRPKLEGGKYLLEHALMHKPCPNCGIEMEVVVKHLAVMTCDACEGSLVWVSTEDGSCLISTEGEMR